MQWITVGLVGLAGGSLGLALWWVLSPVRPLRWEVAPTGWRAGVVQVGERMRRRLAPEVLAQAEILQLSSWSLVWMAVGLAIIAGVGTAALLPVRWMGIPVAVAAFYVAPSMSIRRRFRAYQRQMRVAFESQVLLLRIYFDLGMSVTTAFRTMRSALHGSARQEVDRLLSDLAEGRRDGAFEEWGRRTQLMEYRLLADTIIQQRGRALRGAALDPLDTLLTANRQQSMKTLTDKLTAGAAAVPILSTLSITTLYLYALMSNIQGLQALNFYF